MTHTGHPGIARPNLMCLFCFVFALFYFVLCFLLINFCCKLFHGFCDESAALKTAISLPANIFVFSEISISRDIANFLTKVEGWEWMRFNMHVYYSFAYLHTFLCIIVFCLIQARSFYEYIDGLGTIVVIDLKYVFRSAYSL